MKKNLLFLLLAVLFGAATSKADNVTVTVDVDNAANVVVTTQSPYGTPLSLSNGFNRLTLDTSASPLFVQPADGATITSVTMNNEAQQPNGMGWYTMAITGGMYVRVETSGTASGSEYDTTFSLNNPGSAFLTYDDQTVLLSDAYFTTKLPGSTAITLAPAEGYRIDSVDPRFITATDNGDGTWALEAYDNFGFVFLNTAEVGIDFTVDVNVASNVLVQALLDNDGTVKDLNLNGVGPYTATAPEGAIALQFEAPQGGEILSITRITAEGVESSVNFSSYVGWRSTFAAGDKFIVEAKGPEANVTFYGLEGHTAVDLSKFVVLAGNSALSLSGTSTVAKVRVGETITVSGAQGFKVTTIYGACVRSLVSEGLTQTAVLTQAGDIFLYGEATTGYTISVDNAAAVVIKDKAGNGSELALNSGINSLESVSNPLKIAAADGYAIVSVTLNGEAVTPGGDGSYSVGLEAGSTLVITTRELPKALPITLVVEGDCSQLVVTNDGVNVLVESSPAMLSVLPGAVVDIAAAQGYLLKSVVASGNNECVLDETTGAYHVTVTAAGSIAVAIEKWVADQGNALVTYTCDTPKVLAMVYGADGVRKDNLTEGVNELTIGDEVRLQIFGDCYFKTISVNGTPVELEKDSKLASVKIEDECTLNVETFEYCTVTCWSTSDATNYAVIGNLYVNEIGQTSARLMPGETYTIIPVPSAGFKFDSLSFVYPSTIEVPELVDGVYTFVMTEETNGAIFQGAFVRDEDKPSYLVRGNTTVDYIDGMNQQVAVTRILGENGEALNEKLALEGETVHLLCYCDDRYYCVNFSLFNDTNHLIPQDYVVDPADVVYDNTIEVYAIVKQKDEGVADVAADGNGLSYDAATGQLTATADVRVFNASGVLVKAFPAGVSSLETLPAGLYIVVSGNTTLKIAK